MKGVGDTCPFVWPLGTAGAKCGGGTTAADCEEIPDEEFKSCATLFLRSNLVLLAFD